MIDDLLYPKAARLSDRERALMADILTRLVGDFELAVRRMLSARLAERATVPRDLVVLLANDAIEVARPILFRSTVLGDDELIEIIHHRTLEHQLAIAMRQDLSARVSEALAGTENVDVITTLLQNAGAEI